jgi:hypothetical protein
MERIRVAKINHGDAAMELERTSSGEEPAAVNPEIKHFGLGAERVLIRNNYAHGFALGKSINRRRRRTGRIAIRGEAALHKIGHPPLAIIHFDVSVWMLRGLVEHDGVPNLWRIGIFSHHLCPVPEQEWAVVSGVTRARTVPRA